MAATIQQIANYLDECSWKYQLDEENYRIFTGVKAENIENFWIAISLDEDGEYWQIVAPQLLIGINNHPYKSVLFQALLALSWNTKMVRWGYDQMDGEISATIEFPLEDGVLTQKQFERCLESLVHLVDQIAMPRLKVVLETGIDPGEQELGERLLLSLEEMYPGSLTSLEQAIERRKSLTNATHKPTEVENISSLPQVWQKIWNAVASVAR